MMHIWSLIFILKVFIIILMIILIIPTFNIITLWEISLFSLTLNQWWTLNILWYFWKMSFIRLIISLFDFIIENMFHVKSGEFFSWLISHICKWMVSCTVVYLFYRCLLLLREVLEVIMVAQGVLVDFWTLINAILFRITIIKPIWMMHKCFIDIILVQLLLLKSIIQIHIHFGVADSLLLMIISLISSGIMV